MCAPQGVGRPAENQTWQHTLRDGTLPGVVDGCDVRLAEVERVGRAGALKNRPDVTPGPYQDVINDAAVFGRPDIGAERLRKQCDGV